MWLIIFPSPLACLHSWVSAADFIHLIATCDVCPCAQSPNNVSDGDSLGICNFYASFQSENEKKSDADDDSKCVNFFG